MSTMSRCSAIKGNPRPSLLTPTTPSPLQTLTREVPKHTSGYCSTNTPLHVGVAITMVVTGDADVAQPPFVLPFPSTAPTRPLWS
jgi:hypothetical protein